jgi:hypothetical protein
MASLALGVKFNPTLGGTTDWVYSSAVTGYVGPAASNPAMVDGRTYRYRAESADLSQWEWGSGTYTASTQTLARTTITLSSTGSKVSFSAPPTVGIVPFPADILQFDDAMSLTTTQKTQARANIGVPAAVKADQVTPISAVAAVAPSVQHFHPSACKAWFYATVSAGVVTIRDSYNIASVVRASAGVYNVTMTNAMSSAFYAIIAQPVGVASLSYPFANFMITSATVFHVEFANSSYSANNDPPALMALVFGNQ